MSGSHPQRPAKNPSTTADNARTQSGTRIKTFTNDGLVFDVIDEGSLDGPVIIALHGFPQRARSYRAMIPALTEAGFRVLAPDQRGYSPGARPKGIKPYKLKRVAADILALADQAGAARFHLLGHDWGALVAWEIAANHPHRASTVTALSVPHPRAFLAAMPRGQFFRSWYMVLFQAPWLPELVIEWCGKWPDGWLARKLDSSIQVSAAASDDIRALWREPAAPTATVNWYRAMRYLFAIPGRIPIPTLYVWSTGDAALGRTAAELTANYVDGPYRFEVLDGVSHWIPEERPDDVAAMVIDHIAEHG